MFKNKRIMVVAAHPDDELLGLGATLNFGKSFPTIFWKYRKAWKLMERELLDMMNQ